MHLSNFQLETFPLAKSELVARARVVRESGNNLVNVVQADFISISYRLFDSAGQSSTVQNLVISDVVFNSLQVGSVWTVDNVGFNFRFTIPASLVQAGNRNYSLEIKFTLTSGQVFRITRTFVLLNVQSD